jgi:hypothetical protein
MEGQKRDAIPSIFRATFFGTRTHRLNLHILYDIVSNIVTLIIVLLIFALYHAVYNIVYDIVYDIII